METKEYIHRIKVLAEADIMNGNVDGIKKLLKQLISEEKYEECEGIKQALIEYNGKKVDSK